MPMKHILYTRPGLVDVSAKTRFLVRSMSQIPNCSAIFCIAQSEARSRYIESHRFQLAIAAAAGGNHLVAIVATNQFKYVLHSTQGSSAGQQIMRLAS